MRNNTESYILDYFQSDETTEDAFNNFHWDNDYIVGLAIDLIEDRDVSDNDRYRITSKKMY